MALNRRKELPYPDNLLREILTEEEFERVNRAARDFDASLEYVLQTLTVREYQIIKALYQDNYTFRACGNELHLSHQRISDIKARALRKLRHRSRKNLIIDGVEHSLKLAQERACATGYKRGCRDTEARNTEACAEALSPEELDISVIPIIEMALSTRAHNSLLRAGLKTVYDVSKMTYGDLLKIRCAGKKTADEVTKAMREQFGVEIERQ